MDLFKKKAGCSCGGLCDESAEASVKRPGSGAKAKILGGGCAKCNALEAATVQALGELGLDTEIDHVRDYGAIAGYGVMSTPALVYDGRVLSYGKVLTSDEVKKLIEKSL